MQFIQLVADQSNFGQLPDSYWDNGWNAKW